jgi:hypothetical protein
LLVVWPPDNTVASDQCRQVGASVAASNLAGQLAAGGFDVNLNAKMRNHQAGLLGAKVATDQAFLSTFGATFGASCALVLDFLDAPVLAAGKISFGHGLCV